MRRLAQVMRSALVYRGPSTFDGAEIYGIVTGLDGGSNNVKTGAMAQLWILRADSAPHEAQKSGADVSVCGACPLRPKLANAGRLRNQHTPTHKGEAGNPVCYVQTFQGPRAAWAYQERTDRGVELDAVCDVLRRTALPLRLGAYGDPAALPSNVVLGLAASSSAVTGYTHAWRQPGAQWARQVCMASVETEQQAWQAWAMGWRTYRIGDRPLERHEVACPYPTRGVQCVDCGLCQGQRRTARSIVIGAH